MDSVLMSVNFRASVPPLFLAFTGPAVATVTGELPEEKPMNVRVAFLRRDENGEVLHDGIELAESFRNLDYVPRIGETVVVPKSFRDILQPHHPLPQKRFEIVAVEHRWETLLAPVLHIYLSTLKGAPVIDLPKNVERVERDSD